MKQFGYKFDPIHCSKANIVFQAFWDLQFIAVKSSILIFNS